jgi:hypothetical protein
MLGKSPRLCVAIVGVMVGFRTCLLLASFPPDLFCTAHQTAIEFIDDDLALSRSLTTRRFEAPSTLHSALLPGLCGRIAIARPPAALTVPQRDSAIFVQPLRLLNIVARPPPSRIA